MTREELLARRWGAVLPGEGQSITQAVERLVAVQAQDFTMALLAAGLRSPGCTAAGVEAALSDTVVRTHILRPTWHLVARDDLRWLMELTARRVAQAAGTGYRVTGLTPEVRGRARDFIAESLASGPRTRVEILNFLSERGMATDGLRSVHLLMDAELALVVCNGPRRGKSITYDLVDRRVPPAPPLPREEAVARLVLRYLRGHGPATDRDLSWWSGLSLTDVRRGLEANRSVLANEACGEALVWYDQGGRLAPIEGYRWLPAYDEALVAFADRSAMLDEVLKSSVLSGNGIFYPVVVFDGRVVGTWKRVVREKTLEVDVTWFQVPPGAEEARQVWQAFLREFG